VNPVVREMLDRGTATAADGAALPLHSHLPLAECEVLQDWVLEHRPRRLLEIGCAYGVSTVAVCEAVERLGGAEVYHVVDPHQHAEWRGAGLAALERAGYRHLVELHEEASETVLPRLLAAGGRLDFAFVDGWHSFDQVMMETYYLNRLLAPGGLLVFDDVHLPAVRHVLAFLATLPAYEPLPLPERHRRRREARVRRLMGAPEYRVAGFRKVAEDARDRDFWVEPS
jgi:predicted O-methyltransferase YrrM